MFWTNPRCAPKRYLTRQRSSLSVKTRRVSVKVSYKTIIIIIIIVIVLNFTFKLYIYVEVRIIILSRERPFALAIITMSYLFPSVFIRLFAGGIRDTREDFEIIITFDCHSSLKYIIISKTLARIKFLVLLPYNIMMSTK